MNVAFYAVDGKIPNLALMKLSRFHQDKGHTVEWYSPLSIDSYDRVYASKIFTTTDGSHLLPGRMEIGGTGWDMTKTLPPSIEALPPDYSLYSSWEGNIGFTMRGCRYGCRFCVVPEKEGRPVSTNTIADLMVRDSRFLVLLDNDPFGNPDWRDRFQEIRDRDLKVNFSQGINIRTLTDEQARALASVRFTNLRATRAQVYFAWDHPRDERRVLDGIERCRAAGIKPWKMGFYILIGFQSSPEQDLHRVETILAQGCDPFVMPFKKDDPYQKSFARWVNRRLCRTVAWRDYRSGRGTLAREVAA